MSGAAETILNVDDSEAIRYAKSRILRRAGYRVLEAATGTEALRLVVAEGPALVLLDVNLPDIHGLEVCRRIKEANRGVLVLQSSASFVESEDRVRGLDSGADSYLSEPVTPAELVAAVRALLRLRSAERAVRENEARDRIILDSATDYAILTIDLAGLVTRWSAGAELILGFAAEEIIGRPVEAIFTPEDREAGRPAEEMRGAREDGEAPDERWMQRRNGERFWAHGTMRPLRDADGSLRGYLKIFRDETERRRTEAALAESEAKFRAITDAMPQIVWSTTPDGTPDYFNRRWFEYTGLAGEADEAGFAVVHPEDRERVAARWQHALAAGADYSAEMRIRGVDGTWRWFISRALPIRDADARIIRWFGTSTDIQDLVEAREVQARGRDELERLIAARTAELEQALQRLQREMAERERTEAVLRQSQKMEAVGQLTGGIAHDFNNLLTGIAGSLELIRTRVAQGRAVEIGSYVTAALGEVARASSLTHRLLAFARRQALDPKPIDANRLVGSIEDLIRRTVGPQVRLQTELASDLWTTLCDINQLENALLNLCINARDAMPEGGRLTIATANTRLEALAASQQREARAGDYVVLSVRDTGTGMSPDVAARAFDPFFTTKPLGQGTGLGLSMVYGFVRQSDGHVQIETAPGRGTAIHLYLPRYGSAQASDQPSQPAADAPAALRPVRTEKTVLVAEDETLVRAILLEVLADLGHVSLAAADGPAALRILQSGARVDLLVTDIGLTGMNGRQLAEAARQMRPGLKVLFVTGYAGDAVGGSEVLEPGTEMVAKPFALAALAERIEALIGS
jgi:PAS domain S-box-containing protein